MRVRCEIAVSVVDGRAGLSAVLACAVFVFVNWHYREKSLVS